MYQKGVVKKFFTKKGFGFLVVENSADLFFHISDEQGFVAGKNSAEFSGHREHTEPKEGDKIVFKIAPGKEGPLASPWGFAADFERVGQEIASRPVEAKIDCGEEAHEGKSPAPHKHAGTKKRFHQENTESLHNKSGRKTKKPTSSQIMKSW